MLKKIRERNIHLLILVFFTGLFLGTNLSFRLKAEEPSYGYLDYFHQTFQILSTEYVEKIDPKQLFYGAIRGMVQALGDPFSRFLNEEDFAELKEETSGKFVGIGVEITARDGEIVIISPIEDTPAMRAGLRAGDIITAVNGTEIKNKSVGEIIKLIRGIPSTSVRLTVKRESADEPLAFDIEREQIKMETVRHDIFQDRKVGYIKVKVFSTETPKEIEKALAEMNAKGVDKLIVDLRWNPGGQLDKSIIIANYFLEKDKLIVSTRGREGTDTLTEYKARTEPLYNGKLVVLVNKGSASASEIFSGAMRDNGRAKLVGEKTFGKGSVQKIYSLSESIGLAVTIAKYYTPSGVSIHGKGIIPDYLVEMEMFSEEDRPGIIRVNREKLIDEFMKSHKGYTSETRKEFLTFLASKNITISEKTASYLLKTETGKFSKQPVYDLEFDSQLKKALDVVDASN
ncbi:MAG: S41 family peptidase [Spirochaetes bacterium]|nr:MAG: S41 family peptidase [Spirochaetota bacterium]